MKISMSLPDADVVFLDRYAARHELGSRSAALRRAVALLRAEELGPAYADAWREWEGGEADAWEVTVGDGIGAPRCCAGRSGWPTSIRREGQRPGNAGRR